MTSIAIEEQFVKNFILKDKVKRICGELASKTEGRSNSEDTLFIG